MSKNLSAYNPMTSGLTDANKPLTKDYVNSLIDDDSLFRWLYIPFVVVDIMRDYLDSCYDIASLMKLSEVKKVIRDIKEIEREYEYQRKLFFEKASRDVEVEHAEQLQDDMSDTFGIICKRLGKDIESQLGPVILDKKMFIIAGYMAEIIHRAVTKYTAEYIIIMKKKFNLDTINVMPPAFSKLRNQLTKMNSTFVTIDETSMNIYSGEVKYVMDSIVLFDDETELKKVV